MADQEYECYKGNIDVERFKGKCNKIWKIPQCKDDYFMIRHKT